MLLISTLESDPFFLPLWVSLLCDCLPRPECVESVCSPALCARSCHVKHTSLISSCLVFLVIRSFLVFLDLAFVSDLWELLARVTAFLCIKPCFWVKRVCFFLPLTELSPESYTQVHLCVQFWQKHKKAVTKNLLQFSDLQKFARHCLNLLKKLSCNKSLQLSGLLRGS